MVAVFSKCWDEWERAEWDPPPEETIDKWAERCLRLPRGVSAVSGQLSLDMAPYTREWLRAVDQPSVEEICLCTSSQVAKTTTLIITALYFAANDPWNMLYVMPNEDEALEIKNERFIPKEPASPSRSTSVCEAKPPSKVKSQPLGVGT